MICVNRYREKGVPYYCPYCWGIFNGHDYVLVDTDERISRRMSPFFTQSIINIPSKWGKYGDLSINFMHENKSGIGLLHFAELSPSGTIFMSIL